MIYANSKKNLLLGLTFSGALYSMPSIAIIEGVHVPPNSTPYMVYLESSHCSGVLIAPKTVLTARHCIWNIKVGSHVDLLHVGAKVKVAEVYENGIYESYIHDDDIAILELENMPDGATYLPVAHDGIPLGAKVFPIGYSFGQLSRTPVPATVVAKDFSPNYEREIEFSKCHNSKYFSNQYFTQLYPQAEQSYCDTIEREYENLRMTGAYLPNRYSITVENPPLDETNLRREVNSLGTVTTKYATAEGDRGGPLIYKGKVYGINGLGLNPLDPNKNQASFYAGFTGPGVLTWIEDTARTIQNKPMAVAASSSVALDVPIASPRN